MQDHTRQFEMAIILTASALFGVASMYASQVAPLLFAGSDNKAAETRIVERPDPVHLSLSGGAVKISLSDADAEAPPYTEQFQGDKTARPGDSVVPNAQSCPAAGAANLAQPLPGAGSPLQQDARDRSPAPNGAALGTGSGCPPALSDAARLPKDGPAKPEPRPNPQGEIARSGGLSGPVANP